MRSRGLALALVVACVGLTVLADVARAETIEVTTTADPVGATCPGAVCSLREAAAVANSGATIKLSGSSESPKVYELTQGSQIVVAKSLTIEGDGPGASIVKGSANVGEHGLNRILKASSGTLKVDGVTFTGGTDANDENFSDCSPCETLAANGGGALFNERATVTLDEVAFEGDGEGGGQPAGGAIGNAGTLQLTNVSFTRDGAAFGGALFSRGGTIAANGVTFEEDGSSDTDGGAVFLYGAGSATFINTTIVGSGAPSTFGGGIDNQGSTLTLTNDTLAGNVRGSLETDEGASTTVQNTIIASGFSDETDFDCVAAGKGNGGGATTAKAITKDLGNNIDQDGVCGLDAPGDKSGVDPLLAPIANNGGPTLTEALLPGSPAIEAGNDAACPPTDQRGIARPQGAHCDIGAFEAAASAPASSATASGCFANGKVPVIVSGPAGTKVVDYILDGAPVQSIPTNEAGEVTIPVAPGQHTLEYWGVGGGIEENPHHLLTATVATSPTLTIASDQGHTTYELGEPASVTITATGLGMTSNPSASGVPIPTTTPGTFTVTRSATSVCGTTEHSFSYTVLAPPVLGKSVNVDPIKGKVLIALPAGTSPSVVGLPGSLQSGLPGALATDWADPLGMASESISKGLTFIPLTEVRQIPVGSILEATAGVARITTATAAKKKLQAGEFGAGIFKLLQARKQKGLTELDIMNAHTARQVCATLGKRAGVMAKLSSKVLGQLNANAHGKFTTKGQYSAATVRGTVWSVTNECDGTLTKVQRGVVSVRDFVRRKTITLFTGQSYLARP